MPVHFKKLAIFTVMGSLAGTLALAAPGLSGVGEALGKPAIVGLDRVGLVSFYASRSFALAWSDADAHLLQGAIAHASEEGLEPAVYTVSPGASAAERDVLLTRTALQYARDVRIGREGMRTRDADVDLPAAQFDASAQLQKALQGHMVHEFLKTLPPAQPGYGALKTALVFYQGLAVRGGWAPLAQLSDADLAGEAAEPLRRRLAMEYPRFSGLDLVDQIKRFQANHGLPVDGKVGRQTLNELNVPVQARLDQIAANMERWRWLPSKFEENLIAINVPDASLSLTLHNRVVLESRVVVGKPNSPTPILRAMGAGVTVNPPWTVPASIARKEILPKLKANPAYLQQQDMILLDGPPGDPYGLHVPWQRIPAGSFPYRIQQHPGKKNSLGVIKIELPNRFAVYLHDTPTKGAFARPVRAVSHGCVRVEQILPLASYVLSESLDGIIKITDAMDAGNTRYFPLATKMPVYFLYWTAFVDREGAVQFRSDIYGRDQRLIALQRALAPIRISAASVGCPRG